MNIFETIGKKIWDYLGPKVDQKFAEWLPIILKAIMTAAIRGGGKVVVDGTDKVTDIIPGDLDDRLIDNKVQEIVNMVTDLFGGKR